MRRFLSVLSAVVTLAAAAALLAAPSASAADTPVDGFVVVFHNGPLVSYNNRENCSSTTECSVTVPIPKRDFNRVGRWCGTTEFDVTVANPSVSAISNDITCTGNGGWSIEVFGQYTDFSQTTPVGIHITVTAA